MTQLNLFDSVAQIKGATKVCNKCNKDLPLTDFSSHSGANYLRPECKKCNYKLSKIRLELKAKYGNPPNGYKCPVCSKTEEEVAGKGNNKNGAWVLDHCHKTDAFRGWLCHACNRGIGCFNDDAKIFKNVIKYLEKNEPSAI